MTSNQSEALWLANAVENYNSSAASELRRLHEVNAELVEALKRILEVVPVSGRSMQAKAAIAKATGE